MRKNDKIFVAGHNGLVGKCVLDLLKKDGYKNLITINRKKLDLRNFDKVWKYFKNKKVDYMIMAAARAGGIIANSTNQKDFFLENIEIQNSLLKLALKKKIKRTIYLGTSCIYPKFSKIPMALSISSCVLPSDLILSMTFSLRSAFSSIVSEDTIAVS